MEMGFPKFAWLIDSFWQNTQPRGQPEKKTVPAPRLPAQEEGVYTDGAGRAGEGCISTCGTYLLGASGFLTLYSPAPGAREFSVTVSLFGKELRFTVTLEQEVPPL